MELTEDILRRIMNNIMDLRTRTSVLETLLVEKLGGDYRQVDEMLKESRKSPGYQKECELIFQQIRDGD